MDRSELTPKQQASEAIRQAEAILIVTGQHPSVDQVVSVMALATILRKLGKKVTALVSDQLPKSVNFLPTGELDKNLSGLRDFIVKVDLARAEVDKLKYTIEDGKLNVYVTPFKGGFAPSDVSYGYGNYHYDLSIVLGVPTRGRIDRVYDQNPQLFATVPIINIDFHRSNENFGAINLIESTAASLCEILVALSESLQTGLIDAEIATLMLTGLMASTDRFTATHTTSKALTVAAQMMAAGANQQQVVRGLYRSPDRGDRRDRQDSRPKFQAPQAQPTPPVQPQPTPQPAIEPVRPQPEPLPQPGPAPEPTLPPQPSPEPFNPVPEPATPPQPNPAPDPEPAPAPNPGPTPPNPLATPAEPEDYHPATSDHLESDLPENDERYSPQLNTYRA